MQLRAGSAISRTSRGRAGTGYAAPKRPSQVVNESTAYSQTGQHIVISMDRVSTGGTRHVAQFHRQTDGPMSAAERAKKKRVRASLFPKEHAVARSLDATRKREAKERAAEDSDAANDWQRQMTPTTAQRSLCKVTAPRWCSPVWSGCSVRWSKLSQRTV